MCVYVCVCACVCNTCANGQYDSAARRCSDANQRLAKIRRPPTSTTHPVVYTGRSSKRSMKSSRPFDRGLLNRACRPSRPFH